MTTHTLRHSAHLLVAALLAVSLLIAIPSVADAAGGRLTIGAAIAGERTVATGSVPVRNRKARTVALQRKTGTRWVTVTKARTTGTGRFSLRHTQRSTSTTYRVLAPKAGRAKAAATPSRTTRPVSQKGTLTAPAGSRPGPTFEVVARFSPARPGRAVSIQRLVGSTWRTVETGTQSRAGGFRGVVGAPSERGPLRLRAVAAPHRGAASVTSATTTTIVDQADVVSFDDRNQAMGSAEARFAAADRTGRRVLFGGTSDQLVGDGSYRYMLALRDMQERRTIPVTVTPTGRALDASTFHGDLSADGRTVVFSTAASDVVAGDTNGRDDVFVWDLDTRRATLLSGDRDGAPTAGGSVQPTISPDGRFVAFLTTDPGLLGGVRTTQPQVVLLDRTSGATTHVSVAPDGGPSPRSTGRLSVSDTGSVVFTTDARLDARDDDDLQDAYVLERTTARPRLVGSRPGANAAAIDLSGDGTTIVVHSVGANDRATAVVRGDRTQLLEPAANSDTAQLSHDGSVLVTNRLVGDVLAVVAIDLPSGRQVALSATHVGAPVVHAYSAGVSGDGGVGYYVSSKEEATGIPGREYQVVARRILF